MNKEPVKKRDWLTIVIDIEYLHRHKEFHLIAYEDTLRMLKQELKEALNNEIL